MLSNHRFTAKLLAAGLALSIVGASCSSDGSDGSGDGDTKETTTTTGSGAASELAITDEQALDAATTYADVVFAAYSETVDSAEQLQDAVATFVDDPTDANLEAAKDSWLAARTVYGPTEVFRFYGGPIDNAETGPEGQINAWPLDEAYIDYTADDDAAGIVNDIEGFPEITTDVLVSANEQGGETNISTGWHAIEFLLWGQDLSEDGPGERPVTDYTTADNADRRGTYLTLLTDLLVEDLKGVQAQWNPDGGEFRTTFLEDPRSAIGNILQGMGALSSGELAGERMAVPYETKDQEDEHSCFSDNTKADIVGNAQGVRLAYTADQEGVDGTSLSDVIAELDADVDTALREQLDANVAAAEALAGPFDTLIQRDDDDPDRQALLDLITSLQEQGDSVAALASSLGLQISIEV